MKEGGSMQAKHVSLKRKTNSKRIHCRRTSIMSFTKPSLSYAFLQALEELIVNK
jgi:hypothetical protein